MIIISKSTVCRSKCLRHTSFMKANQGATNQTQLENSNCQPCCRFRKHTQEVKEEGCVDKTTDRTYYNGPTSSFNVC
jgi:hypothetical protein